MSWKEADMRLSWAKEDGNVDDLIRVIEFLCVRIKQLEGDTDGDVEN